MSYNFKTGGVNQISKSGPALCSSKESLEVLADAGFNVVTLANNHFFDYGQQGVNDTIDGCSEIGIKTVGGGKTLSQARKYLTIECDATTIAVINACEHEFSIATDMHGGSNPLDVCDTTEDIIEAKKSSDYVIVIIHGGVENYPLPTPRMKKIYHHFISMGADAVINSHQHCFSGYEVFQGKPIFYGLGNFCFDNLWNIPMPLWQTGYAVRLTLDRGNISFETIPYEQCGEHPNVKLRKREDFKSECDRLNAAIADDYVLNQKFNDYVITHEYDILESIQPISFRPWAAAFRRGWLGKVYNKKKQMKVKNRLNCESHLDVLRQLFLVYTK